MVQYPTTEAEVWDRVKTVYWDMSELSPNSGIFGISSSEVNVVPAGTTFNVMSARERERTPQYGEIEERYGIFFFFSDRDEPEAPFFAALPGTGRADGLERQTAARRKFTISHQRGSPFGCLAV